MANRQTSFQTDNCDGCCGGVGVAHCRVEEFVSTVNGDRMLSTRHLMLCTECRDDQKPRQGAVLRVVNLRSAAG